MLILSLVSQGRLGGLWLQPTQEQQRLVGQRAEHFYSRSDRTASKSPVQLNSPDTSGTSGAQDATGRTWNPKKHISDGREKFESPEMSFQAMCKALQLDFSFPSLAVPMHFKCWCVSVHFGARKRRVQKSTLLADRGVERPSSIGSLAQGRF